MISVTLAVCLGVFLSGCKEEGGEKMTIEKGKEVTFSYTLKVDGEVIDSSEKHGPITYTHGQGQIIPGLASNLEGLTEGTEKQVTVPPAQAYGKINTEAFKEVPKSSLPEKVEPKEGMLLQVKTQQGQNVPVKISEVKDETIVLDLNHPLAGKTLDFDVKIESIK